MKKSVYISRFVSCLIISLLISNHSLAQDFLEATASTEGNDHNNIYSVIVDLLDNGSFNLRVIEYFYGCTETRECQQRTRLMYESPAFKTLEEHSVKYHAPGVQLDIKFSATENYLVGILRVDGLFDSIEVNASSRENTQRRCSDILL